MKQMMGLGTNTRPRTWKNVLVGETNELAGKGTPEEPALFTKDYNIFFHNYFDPTQTLSRHI